MLVLTPYVTTYRQPDLALTFSNLFLLWEPLRELLQDITGRLPKQVTDQRRLLHG